MATPEDLRANAEYIRAADSFVEVPGGPNNNNYANVRLIVEIAENVGADAVWAGWGHASENPTLPATLGAAARPIAFIGPPGGPMHALGDKIGSTIIAQSAGVPCVPWNGASLRVNYAKEGMPPAVYRQADVRTAEEAAVAAVGVGFPLMIKASEGGGGKGIRKVSDPAGLVSAFRAVQAEVPGSPIFLMKLASGARHLEVQLLADEYGDAIALYGRDCSVQRRHQKIMEEGPVLAAPPSVWGEMERAAVRLAKEVGYVNAGTVEYLFMEEDSSFAFLELNPRLQVEHPVTEMVTNVNLPAAQLQVAMGIRLFAIPDVRRLYGQEPCVDISTGGAALEAARIDFDVAKRLPPRGHVIACRITAENPDSGFQPTSGAVTELNFRSTPDVWGYFSVDSSGRVHEFADSQIGHLFAFGASREVARQHMVLALKELSIRGDIRTTVEYLVHMMESGDFKANRINTAWLDARILDKVTTVKPDAVLVAMIGAVWRSTCSFDKRRLEYIGYLERGQYPPPALLSVDDSVDLIYDSVKYSLHATLSGPNTITLACNGTWVQADYRALSDGGLLISLAGRSHVVYAKEEAGGLRMVLDGATCIFTDEYDPTQLRSAMSGKLARFLVEDGATVQTGTPYAEVEVMKMYMSMTVPEAGTIHLLKPEGSVLEPGELLATVVLEDPSKVRRAEPFMGTLPRVAEVAAAEGNGTVDAGVGSSDKYSRRWHIVARSAQRTLTSVLNGYVVPRDVYDQAWFDHDAVYATGELALLETQEVFAVLASRLPTKLSGMIAGLLTAAQEATAAAVATCANAPELDARAVSCAIEEHAASLSPRDLPAFTTLSQPLVDVAERFRDGVTGAGRGALHALLQQYLAVEGLYADGRRPEDVISDFRAAAAGSAEGLGKIFDTARAHKQIKQRNILTLSVLARVAEELEAANVVVVGIKGAETGIDSPGTDPKLSVATPGKWPGAMGARRSLVSLSSHSVYSEGGGDGDSDNGRPMASPFADEPRTGSGSGDELDITQPAPMRPSGSAPGAGGAGGHLAPTELRAFIPLLHTTAELRGVQYAEVTLETRQMLIVQQLPSKAQRREAVETMLRAMGPSPGLKIAGAAAAAVLSVREDTMSALVDDDQPLLDVLSSFFAHGEAVLRSNAAEVYVRRLYRLYDVSELSVQDTADGYLTARWAFTLSSAEGTGTAASRTSGLESGSYGMRRSGRGSMTMTDSSVDLAGLGAAAAQGSTPLRYGVMACFPTLAASGQGLELTLSLLCGAEKADSPEGAHVLHVSLLRSPTADPSFTTSPTSRPRLGSLATGGVAAVQDRAADDEALERSVIDALTASLAPRRAALLAAGVRRVTFNVPNPRDSGEVLGSVSPTPLRDAATAFVRAVARGEGAPGGPNRGTAAMLGSPLSDTSDAGSRLRGLASSARAAGNAGGGSTSSGFPWIYTFRSASGYEEDCIVRHIEPPASANLELRRLSNFKVRPVPVPIRVVHVYAAEPKSAAKGEEGGRGGQTRVRYFVRAIVRQTARIPTLDSVYEQYPGPERMFVDCLDALNIAMGDALADTTLPVGNNHIFLNVLPVVQLSPEYIETVIKILAKRYSDRLRRLRVSQVEFKINVQPSPGAPVISVRLISSNATGYVLRVDTYVETKDERSGHEARFTSIAPATIGGSNGGRAALANAGSSTGFLAALGLSSIRGGGTPGGSGGAPSATEPAGRGDLDGRPVVTPYPLTSPFERQRALAAAMSDTIYVYDFIELLTRALEIEWNRYEKARGRTASGRRPRSVLSAVEMVLRPKQTPAGASASPVVAKPTLKRIASASMDQFSNEMSGWRQNQADRNCPAPGSPVPGQDGGFRSSRATPAAVPAVVHEGDWELVDTARAPGCNDVGMVAWRLTLYTPQYGEEAGGREVVLIANDITFRAGSFGTAEDRLFHLASKYARERGVPRVYLAANSGARIGLAEEMKKLFRVAWTDPSDPSKGHKYLFLTPADYAALVAPIPGSDAPPPIVCRQEFEGGEERWVITDIIGKPGADLGVENLRGSGTIAGETSRAYSESFTLSYVTGRTVGIGAYLVRLGQRCIQKVQSAPIILTGYEALNKLMGSEVYSSNLQLGGPKVMYNNGVAHETVENDFEGVQSILRWLAFVPRVKGAPLPVMDTPRGDEVDRDVEYAPPSQPADPRLLLTGVTPEAAAAPGVAGGTPTAGAWVPGLFDKDSWRESMGGWAKSVITGRARLGGIPVGVIMPELRTSTAVQPADPAAPTSKENVVAQAGQVWFPDSAFKTSQAIRDFAGEDLPILILANWRGFSGGQRDMFLEVLKYGSYIVDALVACTQPVFVYIPPRGELRGGAWVVVDPTINSDVMEMYSDPTGRGGVLEPAGTAAIKFRSVELAGTAHRLDPLLQSLDGKLKGAAPSEVGSLKAAIRAREEALVGVYLQVAHEFADLHDTPGRMMAMGAINGVVPWRRARAFFYWRLRRKLAENAIIRRLRTAAPQLTFPLARSLLSGWFLEAQAMEGVRSEAGAGEGEGNPLWKDDVRVLRWLAASQELLDGRVNALHRESVSEQVLALGMADASAVVTGVLALVARLPQDRREAVVASLRRGIIFGSAGWPGV